MVRSLLELSDNHGVPVNKLKKTFMPFEIKIAKITNSGKLDDRFLSCQHINSADLNKKGMGDVFALIEILSPWFPTAQIGKLIIQNSSEYYYEENSTSDLTNFENALKKVNEDLAAVTQNGETEWIGNLNGAIMIIVGSSVHLAPTGQIEIYMFRDGKTNHLTFGLTSDPEPHPLKTFSNIISGELRENDTIILANQELYNFIPLETLSEIITVNSPKTAATHIIKILKKSRAQNINCLIINTISKNAASNENLSGELESTFYLNNTNDSILSKIKNYLLIITHPVIGFFQKSKRKIGSIRRESAPPKKSPDRLNLSDKNASIEEVQATLPETQDTYPNQGLTNDSDNLKEDQFKKEFLDQDNRDDTILKDEEIKYSPEYYVHYYENQKPAKPSRVNFLGSIVSFVKIYPARFVYFLKNLYQDKSKRKYLFIAIAILIIVIIFVVSIVSKRSGKTSNLESQNILNEALSVQKEANNLTTIGKNEDAKLKYVSAITMAQKIVENSLYSKDAQEIIDTSNKSLDKMTSTTRFTKNQAIATIDENVNSLFVSSGNAYALTESDIFEINLLGGSPSKAASFAKSKGNFLTGYRDGKLIYLYTNNQNVLVYNIASKKVEQTTLANGSRWETANAICFYSGSLYLLDGVLGQIYRHSSTDTGFKEGEEYISTLSTNLKDSKSLAIDGTLFVLKNDGTVTKIQRSKKQDFSLKGLPTPYSEIQQPLKIFTDSDTPSLYILDSNLKRIIEFDKDGQFIHQYALPNDFNKIKDFVISIKSRKLWVLQDNSIYEFMI